MTGQENLQPGQSSETESTAHDNEERDKTLLALSARIDTLLDTAPDTYHGHTIEGYIGGDYHNTPILADLDSIDYRPTVNGVKTHRVIYTDGVQRYTAQYRETTPKADRIPPEGEINYNPLGIDNKVIIWDVLPDGTVGENSREDYAAESLKTLEARITELEYAKPSPAFINDHEELPVSGRLQRLREFGARILNRIK